MPLYRRSCSVLIGPYNQPGIKLTDIAISFKIKKTTTQTANTLSLDIYNLSDTTRGRIKEIDWHVLLLAGYLDDTGEELLFTGNVTRVTHVYNLPQITTKIECGDGQRELREVRIALSFGGPVSASTILKTIAQSLQITVRDYSVETDYNFDNGFSFVGPAKEALDKICQKLGLEFSIQNGELQILQQRTAVQSKAIVISANTGMIGSPERLKDLENQLVAIAKKPGWRIKSLLNPKLQPGGKISLDSRDAKGIFRIESVEHEGENYGQNWTSMIEVTEL